MLKSVRLNQNKKLGEELMRSIEIGRIQKSKSISIIFRLLEIENQFFVDIRQYVKSNKFTGFTKKGIAFNIKYVKNMISQLEDVVSFVSSKDWEKKFDETYDAQMNRIKEGNAIINSIYEYLDNQVGEIPAESEIMNWVKYCYDFKHYKLAVKIFDSIDEQLFSDDEFRKLKKIVEICMIKSE
ncbi:hypothetical protein ES704_02009 [subsurface metagenome]